MIILLPRNREQPIRVKQRRSDPGDPIPRHRPDQRACKLRQQTVEPPEHELPGVLFCGRQFLVFTSQQCVFIRTVALQSLQCSEQNLIPGQGFALM